MEGECGEEEGRGEGNMNQVRISTGCKEEEDIMIKK